MPCFPPSLHFSTHTHAHTFYSPTMWVVDTYCIYSYVHFSSQVESHFLRKAISHRSNSLRISITQRLLCQGIFESILRISICRKKRQKKRLARKSIAVMKFQQKPELTLVEDLKLTLKCCLSQIGEWSSGMYIPWQSSTRCRVLKREV